MPLHAFLNDNKGCTRATSVLTHQDLVIVKNISNEGNILEDVDMVNGIIPL